MSSAEVQSVIAVNREHGQKQARNAGRRIVRAWVNGAVLVFDEDAVGERGDAAGRQSRPLLMAIGPINARKATGRAAHGQNHTANTRYAGADASLWHCLAAMIQMNYGRTTTSRWARAIWVGNLA